MELHVPESEHSPECSGKDSTVLVAAEERQLIVQWHAAPHSYHPSWFGEQQQLMPVLDTGSHGDFVLAMTFSCRIV